jgi:hypothetical protein
MIKIQFNLDILILRNRFSTSELELLNQVLVRDLSETTTLISVEIDIVDEQSSAHVTLDGELVGLVHHEVLEVGKLEVNLDLVVLQSNEGRASPVARQNQNSRGMYITWASMETSPATVTPPETDLGTVNVGWLPMRSCKGRGQRTG